MTHVQLYGIVLVLAGLALRYLVGSRRYRRRGAGGLQHFRCCYLLALLIYFTESILRLAGTLAIIGGSLLLLLEAYNQSV